MNLKVTKSTKKLCWPDVEKGINVGLQVLLARDVNFVALIRYVEMVQLFESPSKTLEFRFGSSLISCFDFVCFPFSC